MCGFVILFGAIIDEFVEYSDKMRKNNLGPYPYSIYIFYMNLNQPLPLLHN